MRGFFIGLGAEFFSSGIAQVDDDLLPTLVEKAGSNVNPRVIPSYAMLLWFTLKVRKFSLYVQEEIKVVINCYFMPFILYKLQCDNKCNITSHQL